MVIHEVDIEGVAVFNPEDHAPVRANGDRLMVLEVAFQLMQP
jgi:hypothetical protein